MDWDEYELVDLDGVGKRLIDWQFDWQFDWFN